MQGRDRSGRSTPWRRLRSARTRAVLSLGLLVGFGSLSTFAYWTDTATISGGTLQSGSMDMQFDTNGAVGIGTNYSRNNISWSGLAPGERKSFALTVRNVGNPVFTYSATGTRGTSPAWTFTGTPITVQLFTGTPVPDTTYPQVDGCSGASIGEAQPIDATSKNLITTPRDLAGGGSEALCVVVGIASNADNANQSKTGSVALNFTANQKP